MASIVATPDPVTGAILLNVDRLLLFDIFDRVTANGWGVADLGGTWAVTVGPAANFSTDGANALISLSATGVGYRISVTPTGGNVADAEFTTQFSLPVIPSGARILHTVIMRETAAGSYQARVNFGAASDSFLDIFTGDYVAGTLFFLTEGFQLPFATTAPTEVSIKMQTVGDTIRARAWLTSQAEPDVWQVSARNTQHTSGIFGIQSERAVGNLNGTFDMTTWITKASLGAEPLNLYRVTPDGTRTLVRGSGFFMPDPLTPVAYTTNPTIPAIFWDNEAPFDVNVFYELTSELSDTAVLTSNTVNLASGGDAWLRDPYTPSNNLIIEISEVPFDYCDETPRIMFTDLQSKIYDNASGVFDLIDAERPETIAQTRKRYGSTLYLTSKEAQDVTDIEAILAGGYPLLLSLPAVYQFGLPYGTDWVSFLGVQSDPPGVDRRLPTRNWIMPFRLSLPPSDVDTGNTGGNGIGGGDATYDALAASALGLTYNSLTAAATTYNAVAAGTGY